MAKALEVNPLAVGPASGMANPVGQTSSGLSSNGPEALAFRRELDHSLTRLARAGAATRTEVAAARTQLSGSQAASALRSAWSRLFGEAPSDGALSVLVAQWAHETGGGASMFNYNFGGLKGASPSGLATAYWTHEGSGASVRKLVDRFRAYETPADGAADYLRLLHDRYPAAIEAARQGDPASFVHALKQGGYFTDSETNYSRSVNALAQRARTAGYDAIGRVRAAATASAAGAAESPGSAVVDASSVAKAATSRAGVSEPVVTVQPTYAANPMPKVTAFDSVVGAVESRRGGEGGNLAALGALDVAALTDELARAALRIAAADPREDD